jgi:hypothetical protein
MGGHQDILPDTDCAMIAVAPGCVDPLRYGLGKIVTEVHPGLEGLFGHRPAIPLGAYLWR